jgi:hypothetical protein
MNQDRTLYGPVVGDPLYGYSAATRGARRHLGRTAANQLGGGEDPAANDNAKAEGTLVAAP